MDTKHLTISGHPMHLEAFSSSLPTTTVIVHNTTLDTLYHSPSQLAPVREQVLKDLERRGIKFLDFSDLIVPIRSTYTGEVLDDRTPSLVEAVVDMILTQPVNWERVVSSLADTPNLDTSLCIRLLNFGPGTALVKTVEAAAFKTCNRVSVDLTLDNTAHRNEKKPKHEPIAIVGMAVNMPGAPNAGKLWEILEQGINTCTEVNAHILSHSPPLPPQSSET